MWSVSWAALGETNTPANKQGKNRETAAGIKFRKGILLFMKLLLSLIGLN
jgi:hypothetical protein